jgi:iron complex outermembrane receptor protein
MPRNGSCLLACALATVLSSLPTASRAEDSAGPSIVITGRRPDAQFELPLAADRLEADDIQSLRPKVDLSESLAAVPGLAVQNRQNFAQDLQISSRGFGARATFGARGLRFFVDGIPATLPDGQAQISHLDLESVGRIEVLRGPFSVLYGNAAGGVVAAFTEERERPMLSADLTLGAFGLHREGVKAEGASGALHYTVSGALLTTDGPRPHSAAERGNANLRLRTVLDERTQLTLIANTLALNAKDPLGLTHAQFDADPRQTDASAPQFDTRKQVDQTQAGMLWERRLTNGDRVQAMVYGGTRHALQFQALPAGAQKPPTSPGGVIDLQRDYGGTDLRYTHEGGSPEQPWRLAAGVALDRLHEQRQGFNNFIGPQLGVRGALRRDETNEADALDPYLQLEWQAAPPWLWLAGLRGSTVEVRSDDHFIREGNGDDSGRLRFRHVSPVFGVTWRAQPDLALHASAGQGFETPTLSELAYRNDPAGGGTTGGLNTGLRPARSRHFELGAKWRRAPGTSAQLTAFAIDTRDELAVQSNSGGRTVYQNAGRTRRTGLEGEFETHWGGWRARVSAATLHAAYLDAFCNGDCTSGAVAAGNRLPGAPSQTAYAELRWRGGLAPLAPEWRFEAAAEARASGRVRVDDRNTDAAPGYAALNLRAGVTRECGPWRLQLFARADNLTDRRYAGSVIVNESKGRFFEPAPGRNATLGFSASWRWPGG